MTERRGDTLLFHTPPVIAAQAAVGGKKESDGPLAAGFDELTTDNRLGQRSWEAAEKQLQLRAARLCLQKAALPAERVDLALAGDLQAQCTASGYALRELGVPFAGLFGACSTMAEALALGAALCSSGAAQNLLAMTSSHFCAAEKQFRFPLPLGIQRPQSATRTVTGDGAVVLAKEGEGPQITMVTTGKIIDMGITDAQNMGAAMAPAAVDLLLAHFKETGRTPQDYDVIATGDLGYVGHQLVVELMEKEGYDMSENYTDCGILIFDRETQDTHSGGSGCACSAVTFCGYFYPKLCSGEINRMLFIPTGALLSADSAVLGLTIPAVAHGVVIESGKGSCK